MNAMSLHRVSFKLYRSGFHRLAALVRFLNVWIYGCKIPSHLHIGPQTRFAAGGLNLNLNGASIGDGSTIGTGVCMMRAFPYRELPVIGDRVYVSHGVKILGPVVVENDAVVQANAVVTKSVPAYAIVGGVPARILGDVRNLDFDIRQRPSNVDGRAPFLTPLVDD